MTRALLTALALVTATGCSLVPSSDVPTSNIQAEMDLFSTGDDLTDTKVVLRRGHGASLTYVELTQGDLLSVEGAAGERLLLADQGALDTMSYHGALPTSRDLDFQVRLMRPLWESADANVVRMPPPFEVYAPYADDFYVLGLDSIPVYWDERGHHSGPVDVRIEGACIHDYETTRPRDLGGLRLHPNDLQPRNWMAPGDGCEIYIEVERTSYGHLDPALRGGHIRAHQIRYASTFVEL